MKIATIAVRGAESIYVKPTADALAQHAAFFDSQIAPIAIFSSMRPWFRGGRRPQ